MSIIARLPRGGAHDGLQDHYADSCSRRRLQIKQLQLPQSKTWTGHPNYWHLYWNYLGKGRPFCIHCLSTSHLLPWLCSSHCLVESFSLLWFCLNWGLEFTISVHTPSSRVEEWSFVGDLDKVQVINLEIFPENHIGSDSLTGWRYSVQSSSLAHCRDTIFSVSRNYF